MNRGAHNAGRTKPEVNRPHVVQRSNEESRSDLTDREQEVLTFLAEGVTNEEIATSLVISPKTVARHRENIMRKLNLHSRAELVRYAIRKGIIKA